MRRADNNLRQIDIKWHGQTFLTVLPLPRLVTQDDTLNR